MAILIDKASAGSSETQIIRETLRSIVNSPQFSKSKRYPAFLEYVVQNTLEGNQYALKERVLATEVFGRAASYDSSTDTVVRVAAGEVRRRLNQYFNDHPFAPVRIELPIGSYAVEFHFSPPTTDENSSITQPAPANAAPASSENSPAQDESLEQPGRRGKYLWLAAITSAALLLTAGLTYWNHLRHDPARNFWRSLLLDGQPAMILPGKIPNYTPGIGVGQQLGDNPNFNARSVLSLEDAIVLTQVCNTFREYKHDCNISEASTLSLENLSGKSLVLIGAFNNAWMMKLLAPLPYQLKYFPGVPGVSTGGRAIVEHTSSGNTPLWTTREGAIGPQGVTDYVILARFHSDITDSMVVGIAGLHPAGTIGGAEYLSSPQKLAELFSKAPKGWKGINFEAVLQINVLSGSPGRPTVVAARFW